MRVNPQSRRAHVALHNYIPTTLENTPNLNNFGFLACLL